MSYPFQLLRLSCLPLLLVGQSATSLATELEAPIPWNAKLSAGAGVSTVPVQTAGAGSASMALQGTVVLPAQQSEMLSMPVAGVVQAVLVTPMQSVRAGQPVARIMSPQLVEWQREWLLTEAQARLARDRAQRDEQLFADGIVAEHRRNESRSQAEMATLAARERRQALRLAGMSDAELAQAASSSSLSPLLTLTAPATGQVMDINVTPGQRFEAGSPVAAIGRSGRLAIELQASSQQARRLRVGDKLGIEGCKTAARISAISSQVSTATQSVQLRAELTGREDCLRINQFVQASWQGTSDLPAGAQTLSVPAAAVVQHGGQTYVFVRLPQGFRAVPVKVGPGGGGDTPILSGLNAGDEVAVKGVIAIKGAWLGLGPDAAAPAAGTGK